jgi:hypothetical protein
MPGRNKDEERPENDENKGENEEVETAASDCGLVSAGVFCARCAQERATCEARNPISGVSSLNVPG